MLKVKDYRSFPEGLHKLIALYLMVGSGIMLTKDQALIAAFFVTGMDLSNMTPLDRNRLSARCNEILNHYFKSGWVTYFEVIRQKSPGYPDRSRSAFNDPISQLMDDERRADFEQEGNHYDSKTVLVIRYKPLVFQNQWFKKLFYSGKQEDVLSSLEQDIHYFERHLQSLVDAFTGTLTLTRMREYNHPLDQGHTVLRDELLNYLNFTITCENNPVNKPTDRIFTAEDYLGVRDFFPGDILKIGKQYVVVLSLSVTSKATYPNMLDLLNHLPIEYRWITRMIHLDSNEAVAIVQKIMRAWQQQEKNGMKQMMRMNTQETENMNAFQMRMDASNVTANVHSGEVGYGYCTQNIVLFSEKRSDVLENARLVIRELSRLGHSCFVEELNAVEAWLGTIPGNVQQNVRKQITHTEHLANMLPLTSVWTGHDHCPNPLMQESMA